MGYADLGAFGSEIPTPNLDRLAVGGVRFTRFRAAAACSPSRAMLLTGVDAPVAGLGNMAEELAPNQVGKPGYEGELSDRVVTLATRLQATGYRTLLSGKWHLGDSAAALPSARGFDHSFALASGGASHFADMRPAYAKSPTATAAYFEDGVRLERLPPSFRYSSQFYVDYLLDRLPGLATDQAGERAPASEPPFFALLSFTAPHWPLQAPDAAIAAFAGRYDAGWEVLLRQRHARQRALGVVAADAPPNLLPWPAWSSLDAEARSRAARAMEIYAAMIHEMDRHTGRLIDALRDRGLLENTIVVFLSDNGAEGHTYDETWPADQFPAIRAAIDARHDFSYERMGLPGSYVFYDAEWARAGSPTSRWHKGFPTEGGLRVPAFVHYPRRFAGRIERTPVFIKDVAPTLLDLVGVDPVSPAGKVPMTGTSLLPLLDAPGQPPAARIEVFELFGKVAVVSDPWKALRIPAPWRAEDAADWALYNVDADPLELHDLSGAYPQRLATLQDAWRDYAARLGVVLPDWVSGY